MIPLAVFLTVLVAIGYGLGTTAVWITLAAAGGFFAGAILTFASVRSCCRERGFDFDAVMDDIKRSRETA